MNKWPDEALERTMLTDADSAIDQYSRGPMACAVASCACHVRALLTRVRELEKREAELETAIENLKNLVSIMETEQERLKRRTQCRES